MIRRARQSWFLTALLICGLLSPAYAYAGSGGSCCCAGDASQAEAPLCCAVEQEATPVRSCCSAINDEAPASDEETPSDRSPSHDCDCPGQCCVMSKVPVGIATFQIVAIDDEPESMARPIGDRLVSAATSFDLVRPPRA